MRDPVDIFGKRGMCAVTQCLFCKLVQCAMSLAQFVPLLVLFKHFVRQSGS